MADGMEIFNNIWVQGKARICSLDVNNLKVRKTITTQDMIVNGDLTVHGDVIQTHLLHVENFIIGDDLTDILTINSSINSDLIPKTTCSKSIGSSPLQWLDAWFNGVIHAGSSLYMKYDGPDGDQYIYFYQGTSPTGASIKWDDTLQKFVFSHPISAVLPAHDILSATHGDTLAAAVLQGSIIVGNATPKWSALVANATATNKFLRSVSGGIPSWEQVAWGDLSGVPASFPPSAHEATHVSGSLVDPFLSTDLLEAIVKRIQESGGPTTLTVGAIADGKLFSRSGANVVGVDNYLPIIVDYGTALPAASATYEGRPGTIRGDATHPSLSYICLRDGSNTFHWVPLMTGLNEITTTKITFA